MRSRVLLLACAVALAAGCSKKSDGGSTGSTATTGSTGTSGSGSGSTGGSSGSTGNVDSGPPPCTTDTACTAPLVCNAQPGSSGFCDVPCQFDDQCAAGFRCEERSGHCMPADHCDTALVSSPVDACDSSNDPDSGYCGSRCRCDHADAGGTAGVCKRVRAYCEPCDASDQCDICPDTADCTPGVTYPARCAPVSDAGSYCLRTTSAQGCPYGYVPDAVTGACQPSLGCNGGAPCQTEQDCVATVGPGNYCDLTTGTCKEYCTFDYLQGTSINCPPNKVCNVLPQYVLADAGLGRYGAGTCGVPCDQTGGTDCAALGATAGLTFTCAAERSGEHRCRPVNPSDGGSCMDNIECGRPNDGGVYAGYCSIYDFDCNYDCRVGIDPRTGKPYADNDCAPPSGSATSYKCVASQCVEKNCVEKGGSGAGRSRDFCCGEDRNHTGYLDSGFADISQPANACIPGVDAGEFYTAPSPPWCGIACDPMGPQATNGYYDDGGYAPFVTCDDTSGAPNFDPYGSPNFCLPYSQTGATCMIAAQYSSECPRSWRFIGLQVACQDDVGCDEYYPDGGQNDGGHCVIYPDGGGGFCSCTQPESLDGGGYLWGGECPNETRCDNHKSCIITRGCLATANVCP